MQIQGHGKQGKGSQGKTKQGKAILIDAIIKALQRQHDDSASIGRDDFASIGQGPRRKNI
jgi:hypothetical protein